MNPLTLEARNAVIRRYAAGRTFIDVGGMWGIHGRDSFTAEREGATSVTLLDGYCTDEFRGELRRRQSKVRFIEGDILDAERLTEAGQHDVVWCAGVIYHLPDPLRGIQHLRYLAREFIIILTATIPEVPGVGQACVFFPGLDDSARASYDNAYRAAYGAAYGSSGARLGLSAPFDPSQWYGNWWWGMSPSAVAAMLATNGGEILEEISDGFHSVFVARVSGA